MIEMKNKINYLKNKMALKFETLVISYTFYDAIKS